MSVVVVRHRPNDDRADENQQPVEAESAELAATDPGGVRYATFRLEAGTFVNFADVDTEPNALSSIPAFAAFRQDIADRCDPGEAPHPQPWLGNIALLADA